MKIAIAPLTLSGKPFIQIIPVGFIPNLAVRLKSLYQARWTKETGWYVPKTPENWQQLQTLFGKTNIEIRTTTEQVKAPSLIIELPESHRLEVLKMLEQMTIKRYGHSTMKSYKNALNLLFLDYPNKHPKDISDTEIRAFFVKGIKKYHWKETTQNGYISGIQFYYQQVLKQERKLYELRPRKAKDLPPVLSQEEVQKLFKCVENLKHKCILMLIYSGGLRLGEVTRLRKVDILNSQSKIFIKSGKGKKDRYTVLSAKVMEYIREYLAQYNPHYWLFEGQDGGQYSPRSVQMILRKAVEKSGVNPYATVHTLRHSFATHLLENGMDIRYIQELLGHNSVKTTEIYTHITERTINRFVSPLDKLQDI